jgi:hypothetical protein
LAACLEGWAWASLSRRLFPAADQAGSALHFIVEDTTKILFPRVVMVYSSPWPGASLNLERIRHCPQGARQLRAHPLQGQTRQT